MTASNAPASENTLPKLLERNRTRFATRHAMREKEFGIWQAWTWAELASDVRAIACGLHELGFQPGDRLAVIGDNRPRLYGSMVAAQAIGGVPVPMYQDSVAKELAFVVDHSEARFAIAEDQEQVDKLLELKADCPRLEHIVYLDSRGMRHYDDPCLHFIDDVMAAGANFAEANAAFYTDAVARGTGDDIAIMLYTSGTTGQPKGVVLTQDNVVISARNAVSFDAMTDAEETLAYLPMAWVGDNIFSLCEAYIAGFCVSCPESGATVMQDLKEIGPTFFFAPPRIFENLLTSILIRMEDASRIKRRAFKYFMDVAKRVGGDILDGNDVSGGDRFRYRLGEKLVYGPLKNTLGMSRVRVAYTAGEAIGPDIFDFYRSLGINIKQLYGQTEASVFITMQPDGQIKPDSVGVPADDVEIKVAENGEVLYRSPGVFKEYFKNPEATAKTKTEDGWVLTGDAGYLDEDGHLKIIDRAKDVGKLNDGTLFAPKYIENKLKFFPNIKEAVVFGDGRDYVCAFLNIDLEAVGSWAERNNVSYASYQELATHPDVIKVLHECVDSVNSDLANDPKLSGSRIHRFLSLPKELDADDGELTRTRKVRRTTINERYAPLITALYDGSSRAQMQAQMTFEDGRTGTISADVAVHDTNVDSPEARAAA